MVLHTFVAEAMLCECYAQRHVLDPLEQDGGWLMLVVLR